MACSGANFKFFTLVTSSPLHYPCPYLPQKDTKQNELEVHAPTVLLLLMA